MKVRALKSFASEIVVASPGLEFECPDKVAVEWLRAGMIERVAEVPETATISGGEQAVSRAGRR